VLGRQVGGHAATAVRFEPIPNERDLLTAEVPLEGTQERDQLHIGIGARVSLKVQARTPAVRPKCQRRGIIFEGGQSC
jgi:hypothetical protein